MLYPDPHVMGGIAELIDEDNETVAGWLAETGDGATVEEVISLITELRDEIMRSRNQDAADFPVNEEGWTNTLNDYRN